MKLRVQSQLRHAHDDVHGRADLVAHVGQKLAFEPHGFLGPFFLLAQLLRALLNLLLEMLIPMLDLREHLVKSVDKIADLVVVGLFGTQGIVLPVANPKCRARQADDRVGDESLQPRGDLVRHKHGERRGEE